MKFIRQQFHTEIRKNQKLKQFSHLRKQLHVTQQSKKIYDSTIENNQNLNSLLAKPQILTFYRFIDDRFQRKIYQNQTYFLQNLKFIHYLIYTQTLPIQKINLIIAAISNILQNPQLYQSKLVDIFNVIDQTIRSNKYSQIAISNISYFKILKYLYEYVISQESHQFFFRIISIYKLIANPLVFSISHEEIINCLHMNILTSNNIQELYQSYGMLGEIFSIAHDKSAQLYYYGSILNKTFQDIQIEGLIEPISYFLLRVIDNKSILKLMVQMSLVEVLIQFVFTKLLRKSNVLIYNQQSIWFILMRLLYNSQNAKIINRIKSYIHQNHNKNYIHNSSIIKIFTIENQINQMNQMESTNQIKSQQEYSNSIHFQRNIYNDN